MYLASLLLLRTIVQMLSTPKHLGAFPIARGSSVGAFCFSVWGWDEYVGVWPLLTCHLNVVIGETQNVPTAHHHPMGVLRKWKTRKKPFRSFVTKGQKERRMVILIGSKFRTHKVGPNKYYWCMTTSSSSQRIRMSNTKKSCQQRAIMSLSINFIKKGSDHVNFLAVNYFFHLWPRICTDACPLTSTGDTTHRRTDEKRGWETQSPMVRV